MFQLSLSPYFSNPCENPDFFVLYIDEVILQRTGVTDYYFTHDYRYSVTSLTNSSGNIVESYDYKVYGERTASGSGLTDVGYTGQRHDSETGLMYFKNRYYSTSMGQFVTRDPLGYVDGMSMYLGYFGGNGVDPDGLDELVHATTESNAQSIIKEGLKAGKDGTIWMSSTNIAGSGAGKDATVHLIYDVDLKNVEEVPDCIIEQAKKDANSILEGTGSENRGKRFARLKGDLIAEWVKKQKGLIFKMKAPPPYSNGIHYIIKPEGFKSSLIKITGPNAKAVLEALGKEKSTITFKMNGKAAMALKIGGKVLLVGGVAASVYDVYTAEDKFRAVTRQAGLWAGVWLGAQGGAYIGGSVALIGGQAGPQVAVPEEVVTVPIASLIGGILGGIGGGILGYNISEIVYDGIKEKGFKYE